MIKHSPFAATTTATIPQSRDIMKEMFLKFLHFSHPLQQSATCQAKPRSNHSTEVKNILQFTAN